MQRCAKLNRKSNETDIKISLDIDGKERAIDTGIGFFDHMLDLMAAHGSMGLQLSCKGDLDIDCHHSIEDVGILLGRALRTAAGERIGIKRYGTMFLPMDEALAMVSLDFGGRAYLVFDIPEMPPMIGNYDTSMTEEFLRALCFNAGITLHVKVLYGSNGHHIIESIMKALGRALKEALTVIDDAVSSTKGLLD